MNLIVVYKGNGKIAADQLKKLLSQKDDNGEILVGQEDGIVDVVAMEEHVYLTNSKATPYKDPILFIDDVKPGVEIKPIAKPKNYGFGVICGFAGPQALLTVNAKALRKAEDYDNFVEKLDSMTFQQIHKVPRGINAIWDALGHGVMGVIKSKEDIKRQQLIYGVTKLYYEDLHDFMESYGK